MNSPVHYVKGKAYIDDLSLEDLAHQYSTPLYVYSQKTILDRCEAFRRPFAHYPTDFFFAVKANLNSALLKLIFNSGFGADVVSGGELVIARHAGLSADKIVFSGVGKTDAELRLAAAEKIQAIQVESVFEIEALKRIARPGDVIRLSLRLNLDIDAHTHRHITTATAANKFGINKTQALAISADLTGNSNLKIIGLSCHLGSQIKEAVPFQRAAKELQELGNCLRAAGHHIEFLSLGGGLGIAYENNETALGVSTYADAILGELGNSPFRLHLEPGRWIIAEAGILLSRVIGTKTSETKTFVVIDAGMNDLLRPALYEAHHPIKASTENLAMMTATVVGPVCESADTFATGRSIPTVDAGDLLILEKAGAYGMSMASTYNGRPRPAEILVTGKKALPIRRRETIEDLMGLEP